MGSAVFFLFEAWFLLSLNLRMSRRIGLKNENFQFYYIIETLCPWELYRNGNSESSVICQYVCQSDLFVQPIRSFNLISLLVLCLFMKITRCLLVLFSQ